MSNSSNYYFNAMTDKIQEGTVKYGAGERKSNKSRASFRTKNLKKNARNSVRKTKNVMGETVNNSVNLAVNTVNNAGKIVKNTAVTTNRTAKKTLSRGRKLTSNLANNSANIIENTLNSANHLTHDLTNLSTNAVENTVNTAVETAENVVNSGKRLIKNRVKLSEGIVDNVLNNTTKKRHNKRGQKSKTRRSISGGSNQMGNYLTFSKKSQPKGPTQAIDAQMFADSANNNAFVSAEEQRGGTAYNNPPPNPMTTPNYLSFTGNSSPQGPTDAVPIQMAASSKKYMQPYVKAMNSSANGIVSNAAPFSVVSEEHTGGAKKKTKGKKASPKKKTTTKKSAPKKKTTAKKSAPKKKTTAKKSAPKKKTTAKKTSTKKKSHKGGSDWRSTVYSRGPVNYPDNGWYNGKDLFRQFNKTSEYIPNSELPWAAAPGLTPGKGTIPKPEPPYAYNYFGGKGKRRGRQNKKGGANGNFEYTKMFNQPLSPCYKPKGKPEIFKAGWHA